MGHVLGWRITVTDVRMQVIYKQLWTCHYTTVCVSYGKSDLRIVYLHKLLSCLCPGNEAAVLWRGAYCYWPWSIVDVCCVVNQDCVIFTTTLHWTVTIWSSLEACLQSVRWLKVRADLNTLNHFEVSWSTEPILNICIIRYFSSVINSNKRRSNETLVGVVIQTSDLRDRRRACYQLSQAASRKATSHTPIFSGGGIAFKDELYSKG
jgi:hypothetical protein